MIKLRIQQNHYFNKSKKSKHDSTTKQKVTAITVEPNHLKVAMRWPNGHDVRQFTWTLFWDFWKVRCSTKTEFNRQNDNMPKKTPTYYTWDKWSKHNHQSNTFIKETKLHMSTHYQLPFHPRSITNQLVRSFLSNNHQTQYLLINQQFQTS